MNRCCADGGLGERCQGVVCLPGRGPVGGATLEDPDLEREYAVPPEGEYMVLGPYRKPEHLAIGAHPQGTTCWFVILKWKGMELFITGEDPREALGAVAEKILHLCEAG
jgi:hypothetical protein